MTARTEFASNPYDTGIQTRLKALLDLQSILKSQQLPADQIQLIRDQVASLSAAPRPTSVAPVPTFTPVPPVAAPPPMKLSQQQPAPTDLQALLSSNSLANLLASAAKVQQSLPTPSHPTIPLRLPQISVSQPPAAPPTTSAGGESSLIASLRAAGMLPPAGSTPVVSSAVPAQASLPYQPPPLMVNTPPMQPVNPARPALSEIRNNVELTPASLKM